MIIRSHALDARKMSFHERLKYGGIICAEGYVFELEKRGYLQAVAFVPLVVLEHPDVVKQLHREFVRCGSDVVVACTYYAHRDKLKVVGREEDLETINRQALRIAREVAEETDTLLAGDICNTWIYNPDDPASHKEVYDIFDEQVRWAKQEGADFIIAETLAYLGEALLALEVIKKYELPAVITFSPIIDKTYDGYLWDQACSILAFNGADVVGLNCARGPATMLPLLEQIIAKVNVPVAAIPVPYRTDATMLTFQVLSSDDGSAFPVNLDPFLLSRREIADFTRQAQEIGVTYFGLCCGTQAHYIRTLAETLGRQTVASAYSPNMSQHGLLGDIAKEHEKEHLVNWKISK